MPSSGSYGEKICQALDQHKWAVKRDEGNRVYYRGNSPFREGSNSGGFAAWVGDYHGGYTDAAGAKNNMPSSGSLFELGDRLGIDRPIKDNDASLTTKRVYSGLQDYAEAHYVNEDVFRAAQWEEIIYMGRLGLIFPTTSGKRVRFLDNRHLTDSNAPFMLWVKDKVNGVPLEIDTHTLYGVRQLPRLLAALPPELPRFVVIVNGPASAVVAQHYGVPAICHHLGEGTVSELVVKRMLAATDLPFVIAYDVDGTGRAGAEKLAAALRPYRRVYIVDMPLSPSQDACDFCGLFQHASYAEFCRMIAVKYGDDWNESPEMPIAAKTDETSISSKVKENFNPVTLEQLTNATAILANVIKRSVGGQDASTAASQLRAMAESYLHQTSLPLISEYDPDDLFEKPDMLTTTRLTWHSMSKLMGIGDYLRSEVYTIAGPTGHGKTWAAVNLVAHLIMQGGGILFPTEISVHEWTSRLFACLTGIPFPVVYDRSYNNQQQRVMDNFKKHYREVTERTGALYTGGDITPSADGLKMMVDSAIEKGNKINWVVVDSGSIVTTPILNESESLGYVWKTLLAIAKQHKIPVFATAQVNRQRDGGLPFLDGIQGSSRIAWYSSMVMAVFNPAANDGATPGRRDIESGAVAELSRDHLYCFMLKNRHSPDALNKGLEFKWGSGGRLIANADGGLPLGYGNSGELVHDISDTSEVTPIDIDF